MTTPRVAGPHQMLAEDSMLDERNGRLICPVAAALVGVCLTGIGLMRVVSTVNGTGNLADDILAFDALLFLVSTLASYVASRTRSRTRLHRLEQLADRAFIAGMLLLTVACFVIAYAVSEAEACAL